MALKWPSIHQRHTYFSICQVHDIFHNRNFISSSDHFQLSNASTRSHPLTIQPVSSSINCYHYSFFVNSLFLWNTIPYRILRIAQTSPFCLPYIVFFFDYCSYSYLFTCTYIYLVLFCNCVFWCCMII